VNSRPFPLDKASASARFLRTAFPRALVPPAREANRRTLLRGIVGWVVAVAGPRGEDEEDLGAVLARDAVPFPPARR